MKLRKIDIVRYYLSVAEGALRGIRDRPGSGLVIGFTFSGGVRRVFAEEPPKASLKVDPNAFIRSFLPTPRHSESATG